MLSTYFRRTAKALRLRGPLDDDPTAKILNTLLVGVLCWIVFDLAVIIPLFASRKLSAMAGASCVGLVYAIALALLYRGSLRAASLVYLCGIWLGATIVIIFTTGIHSPFVVLYMALPISAAWLLGYQAALLTAGICLASSLAMAVSELNGLPMPGVPGRPVAIWATIVWAMIIAAVPVAHILQIYKDALARLREYQGHLEELVEQRTAELHAANQAKSAFLANMSHELRTPLNAILGFSSLAREDPGLSEEHRKDLDIVNRSGEHLLDLIDEVLDLTKIETGRITVENAPFDVSALVRDAVEMMRARARAKNIELLVNTSSSVPGFARSDAAKVRQSLVNLLGNAVKFTEEGSVIVSVDAKPIDARQRLLLIFEVQDTGIGIVPEDQARIFTPFVQVGPPATQNGTGLGLSITRQFVQMMGGTISVQSTPGQGSLFRVELPVERVEESEVAPANDDRRQVVCLAPGQPEFRMLIVEDKRENWLLLQRLLRDAGFPVQVAEDGAQGVEMFRTWHPHLIWMDLRLPVMGGIEARREIRALDGGLQVKIVAISAAVFIHQRAEVLAAGLDDFVQKPYRREEIFDCIARHLGVRYLYRAAPRASPADPVAALRPEALAMLPERLRKELGDALVRLDARPIAEVIHRVSEQDAQLGEVLVRCAKRFAYTEILNALEHRNADLREEVP